MDTAVFKWHYCIPIYTKELERVREVTIKNVLYRGANLFIYLIYYLGLTVVTLQSVKLLTQYA